MIIGKPVPWLDNLASVREVIERPLSTSWGNLAGQLPGGEKDLKRLEDRCICNFGTFLNNGLNKQ